MMHTFLPLVIWIIQLYTTDTAEQLDTHLTAKSQQGLKTKLSSTTVRTIKHAESTFNVFHPSVLLHPPLSSGKTEFKCPFKNQSQQNAQAQ